MSSAEQLMNLKQVPKSNVVLTKRGTEWLMRDDTSLILVDDVELLVLQESLCVVLVPLHVADTLVNLTLGLG